MKNSVTNLSSSTTWGSTYSSDISIICLIHIPLQKSRSPASWTALSWASFSSFSASSAQSDRRISWSQLLWIIFVHENHMHTCSCITWAIWGWHSWEVIWIRPLTSVSLLQLVFLIPVDVMTTVVHMSLTKHENFEVSVKDTNYFSLKIHQAMLSCQASKQLDCENEMHSGWCLYSPELHHEQAGIVVNQSETDQQISCSYWSCYTCDVL